MNKNVEKLLCLIQENPELPVLPMVDGEVCAGEDCGQWMGSIGMSGVDEYQIDENYGEGSVVFRSYGDVDALVEGLAFHMNGGDVPSDETWKKAEEEINRRWKKAICVYINTPEE